MRRLLLTLAMIAALLPAAGQEAPYKFDFGAAVGMSGYLGDANSSNLFKHPGLAADLQFRYLANARWAIRGQLGLQTLKGDSSDFDYHFPGGAIYSFTSTVFDLGGRVEFNFFPYGIGETYKRLRRFTPFVGVGIGMSLATVKDGGGTHAGFNIPLGVGVKYKLSQRLNLLAEFTMTKVFSDRMDGAITDLYTIKTSFLKNTDWYSGLTVGLTYEFGKRCETCNRID